MAVPFEEKAASKFEATQKEVSRGVSVYKHNFSCNITASEINQKYADILEMSSEQISSAGRVISIKGCKMTTFFVIQGDERVQLAVSNGSESAELSAARHIGRGDIIGFTGNIGRSKRGTLTVYVMTIQVLAPCLHDLPGEYYGLKDQEIIYRRRYLDLICNSDSMERFKKRTWIINYLRNFLNMRNFLEVETPTMNVIPGGANAKPFITHLNELKMDMYLRVSPELYLKQLVVGGLHRVFEIGKQFRNEGIDLTHNPEFTSCEFYMAFADYYDLMDLTEELLEGMVRDFTGGSTKVEYNPVKGKRETEKVVIDFCRPYKKIDILDALSEELGILLDPKSLESSETLLGLIEICDKREILVGEPKTLNRVLDKLIGEFIEPMCINPTFLINHPKSMSPLAKNHRDNPYLTERFELFINSKEICNAYTELNNPFEQVVRFEQQANDADAGDDEAMRIDHTFVNALEYGLPPTAGWGIGIDRLVMYLTNAANIRDVILFPTLKHEDSKIGDVAKGIQKMNLQH